MPLQVCLVIGHTVTQTGCLTEPLQGDEHAVRVATVIPLLLVAGVVQKVGGFVAQPVDQVKKLADKLVGQLSHSKMHDHRMARQTTSCPQRYPIRAVKRYLNPMNKLNIKDIGAMRLTLLLLALISLPLVLFADMQPHGIGVMTAYIVPSLVVLFFFVLMLDALMNRVFMIEQPAEVQSVKRLRMWLDLAAGAALLIVWGTYFRGLLQV